jgi:hypothetical protein
MSEMDNTQVFIKAEQVVRKFDEQCLKLRNCSYTLNTSVRLARQSLNFEKQLSYRLDKLYEQE